MRTQTTLRKDRGLSIPELLGVLAVVGILAAVAFGSYSKIYESAKSQKLQSELATLNSAVSAYRGFGGNLDNAETPEAALAQLRSAANSTLAERIPGLSSSMVDRRIAAVKQTEEQAKSNEQRVLWNSEKKAFEIARSGPAGLSSFYINSDDAEKTLTVDNREFAFLYSTDAGGWVWDFAPDNLAAPHEGPTQAAVYDPITVTNNPTPSPVDPENPPAETSPLSAPILSMGSGGHSIREYPLGITISNPNPSGSSIISYQMNNGPWVTLEDATAVDIEPDTEIRAQAIAQTPEWIDSSAVSASFDAEPVTLNAPVIETSANGFGVFTDRLIMVSLEDTNGEDPNQIQYQINDGPWLDYDGILMMHKGDFEDGALIKTQAVSENEYYLQSALNTAWISPDSVDISNSDGAFHDPTGPGKMVTNLEDGEYSNYFEWGAVTTKWGSANPNFSSSWMNYEGEQIDQIVIGEQFKLGDIDYYDGVFKSGTHANKVSFAVGLGIDSEGNIIQTEFDYLFNLAHMTNGQSSFGNARIVMPNSASSFHIDGVTFDLLLEFGQADEEYDVQPESLVETALYGTLFERDGSAPIKQQTFSGKFKNFWDNLMGL